MPVRSEDSMKMPKRILFYMNAKGIVPSSKATGVVEAYSQAVLYEEALVVFNTMNEVAKQANC